MQKLKDSYKEAHDLVGAALVALEEFGKPMPFLEKDDTDLSKDEKDLQSMWDINHRLIKALFAIDFTKENGPVEGDSRRRFDTVKGKMTGPSDEARSKITW